jgi:hypothetical protein
VTLKWAAAFSCLISQEVFFPIALIKKDRVLKDKKGLKDKALTYLFGVEYKFCMYLYC